MLGSPASISFTALSSKSSKSIKYCMTTRIGVGYGNLVIELSIEVH